MRHVDAVIPSSLADDFVICSLRPNASKNRYRNVKPQDQSRVALRDVDPDVRDITARLIHTMHAIRDDVVV